MRGCSGIFFCDVDGTILPHGQARVDQSFFDLVRRSKERGYCFCISSGRYHQSLTSFFKEVENEVIFSASNGCRILYQGADLITPHLIDQATVEAILADFDRWDVIGLISTLDGFYVHKDQSDHPRVLALLERGYTRLYEEANEIPAATTLQVTALCRGNRDQLLPEAKERYGDMFHVFSTGVQLFDICPTNKGESLLEIRASLKIQAQNTWAFGDDENDLAMLREAGRGYLMSNAAEHLHTHGFDVAHDLIEVIDEIIGNHRFKP